MYDHRRVVQIFQNRWERATLIKLSTWFDDFEKDAVIILEIILLVLGLFVANVHVLLWIGIVLLVIAVVVNLVPIGDLDDASTSRRAPAAQCEPGDTRGCINRFAGIA